MEESRQKKAKTEHITCSARDSKASLRHSPSVNFSDSTKDGEECKDDDDDDDEDEEFDEEEDEETGCCFSMVLVDLDLLNFELLEVALPPVRVLPDRDKVEGNAKIFKLLEVKLPNIDAEELE